MTEDGDAKIVAEKPHGVERRLNKRIFVAILVVLILAIIGLIIAIVVVNINSSNDEEIIYEDTTSDGVVSDNLDILKEQINEELVAADDLTSAISIFQEYIDEAANDDIKAELMIMRVDYVMEMDTSKEFGGTVLCDVGNIDRILQNVESASIVANAASYYDDSEMLYEYSNILIERQKEAGDFYEGETVG